MAIVKKWPGLIPYLEHCLGSGRDAHGAEMEFHCPFCLDRLGDESDEPKLTVNVVEGKVHCYRCLYGARSLQRFFRDLNGGMLRMEELSLLRVEAKIPENADLRSAVLSIFYKDQPESSRVELKCPPLPDSVVWLTESRLKSTIRPALDYLKGRGITPEKIARFRIGYCRFGSHAGHLIFPVYQGGEMVYWTTRAIHDRGPKSRNPGNVEGYYTRKQCLLNFDNCVGAKLVCIVEGPFDTMAPPDGVGLMGKKLSSEHLLLLDVLVANGTEEFVVSLDAGEGRAIDELYSTLAGRYPRVTVLPLDYGDPDSRKAEFVELLARRRMPTALDRARQRFAAK